MNNTFSTQSDSFEPPLLPPSADPAQARRDFSRIGLAYAILTLSLQALATGINYLAYFFTPWILSSWWWTWVISLLPLYGMALPLMWLLLRRIPAAPTTAIISDTAPRWTSPCSMVGIGSSF